MSAGATAPSATQYKRRVADKSNVSDAIGKQREIARRLPTVSDDLLYAYTARELYSMR